MRKAIFIPLLIITALLLFPSVNAWINCAPSCPSGYTQIGSTTCSGSTCNITCETTLCSENWNLIINRTAGWNTGDGKEDDYTTPEYPIPNNNLQCFRFTYQGPPADANNIEMAVLDPPQGVGGIDCDSELRGGIRQGQTPSTISNNPWYNNMTNYLGSTGAQSAVNYMLQIARAHTEGNADQTYRDNASRTLSIYCANNVAACQALGGTPGCDTDCYGTDIFAYAKGGYVKDSESQPTSFYQADQNVYADQWCGDGNVSTNRYTPFQFKVHNSTMQSNYANSSCQRTNEAPSASSVNVKPTNPTAGHDLLCNYTFSDPENDFDINSVITWYRNGIYQNLTEHQILPSNYTLPSEQWSCGINPSDGNNIGTNVNATANVTIQNTVANVTFTVANQSTWNTTGYYAGPTTIPIDTQLTTYLMNCTADGEGNCLVPLTFTSTRTGSLRLSNITIYYNFTNRTNAPMINQQTDITVNETQLVQFSINVSDPYNNTFNVTINDPGRFNQTANYSYQWQTGYDDNGEYPVIITATNNLSLSSTMSFTVTVNNVNRPFNLTYNNTAAQENQNVSVNITINDPDNNNSNTLDDNIFTITYNSTFDASGIAHLSYNEFFNYSVNVFINESIYNASINFTLFVLNVNRPPVLNLNNITANEGELITLPNGTDPDNENNVSNDDNSLSYTYSPPFNASGMWQTSYNQSGNYTANVTLSDGQYQVNQTINVSVLNVNQPPTLQFIPNVNVTAPANFTIVMNASDPDIGEVLTYSVNDTHFSQNNNSFQWNATINDVGFYQAIFSVSDGLTNASQLVNITIIGPASIILTNFTTLYNQSSSKIYEFVITNNGYQQLDNIVWSLNYGDGTITTSTTPIFLFIAKKTYVNTQHTYVIGGNVTLTANVTAGNISATQSFNLSVNLPIIHSIPLITGDEGVQLWINATGVDPENQTLTWSINDTHFTQYDSNFTWTPNSTDEGNYSVKVSATDGTYQQNQTVQITIRSGENLTLNTFTALGNTSQSWVFAAELQNAGLGNIPSINFTFAYGDGERTSSTTPASITGMNRLFINIQHNYTLNGQRNGTLNITAAGKFITYNFSVSVSGAPQPPSISAVILSSSNNTNSTLENLTVYIINATDSNNDPIVNITHWYKNNKTWEGLIITFDGNTSNNSVTEYAWGKYPITYTAPMYYNSTAGIRGGAMFFNLSEPLNVTGRIFIANTSGGPLFNRSTKITVMAWVKTTDSVGSHIAIARQHNAPGGWAMSANGKNAVFALYNQTGSTKGALQASSAANLSAGEWHHVAGRYNGTHVSVLLDGNETSTVPTASEGPFLTTNGGIYVGTTNSAFTWNGSIDEVRIYNDSLSNQQIRAIYANFSTTIVEQETKIDQTWIVEITPSDETQNGQAKNSTPLTIVGTLPLLSSTECHNTSSYTNCTTTHYGTTISTIRANCTQGTLPIQNVTAQIYNSNDQTILFVNGTTTQTNNLWTINTSYTIVDSGDMQLTTTCYDTESLTQQIINWTIPWGTVATYDNTSHINTTSVNQNATFNYTTKLSCLGGECGTFNATADPVPAESSIITTLHYGSSVGLDDDNDGYETLTGGIDFITQTQFTWDVNASNLCTKWTKQRNQTLTVTCYGSNPCCAYHQLIPSRTGWNDTYVLLNPQQQPELYTVSALTTYYEEDLAVPTISILSSNASLLEAHFVPNTFTITQSLICPLCSATVPTNIPVILRINVTATPPTNATSITVLPILWTVQSLLPIVQNATHSIITWTLLNTTTNLFNISVTTPPYASQDSITTTIDYKQNDLSIAVEGIQNPALTSERHIDLYTNEQCNPYSCTQTKHSTPTNYFEQNTYQPINTVISIENCVAGYDYCVDHNLYQVYFKSDLSQEDPIRITKDGYSMALNPVALLYEHQGSSQLINEVGNTSQSITSNALTHAQPFGLAIPLTFTYRANMLKDELILPDPQILPSVSGLWSAQNTYLTYKTVLTLEANLTMRHDGVAALSITETPFTTLTIMNPQNEIVFKMPAAFLINGSNRIPLLTTIQYSSGRYIHKTKIPYTLLPQLTYPVIIDPTTTLTETSVKNWGWIKHENTTNTYGRHPQDTEISVLNYYNSSKLIRDRAWMTFNTSTIPDFAYISSVLFNYTVVQGTFEDIGVNIAFTEFNVSIEAYPNNATGYKAIHDLISSSNTYAEGSVSPGTDIATLGSRAALALQNNLTQDHFGIGFKPQPDDNTTTLATPILIGSPWTDYYASYPTLSVTYSLGPYLLSPQIHPAFPQLGQSINCSVNVTDYENDTIKWVNFTINSSIPNTNSFGLQNGSKNGTVWTSASFTPNKIGTWNCIIQASDITNNLSQTQFTFLILEQKTAINTTPGAKPFWTSSLNPQTCNHLYAGQNCTNSWIINATGLAGGQWQLFTIYNAINYTSAFNQTTTPIRLVAIT